MKLLSPDLPELEQLMPYLREINSNNWYTNFGPIQNRFETVAAKFLGSSCSCFANCTLALYCLIKAKAKPQKKLVILPSWTFTATAHAVVLAGLKPYFIDVDEDNQMISHDILANVDETILSKTALIISTSAFGSPLDQKHLREAENDLGIPIIIDGAAQIFTAKDNIFPTAISLHATKLLGVGEGGIVMSPNSELNEKTRSFSNFGFKNGTRDSIVEGTNAKMSEFSAAIGLCQLNRYNEIFEKHMSVARMYLKIFKDNSTVKFQPGWGDEWISSTAIITFSDPKCKAKALNRLRIMNIPFRDWWEDGCHKQQAFSKYDTGSLKNTKSISKKTLGIPFHKSMTIENIESIYKSCV